MRKIHAFIATLAVCAVTPSLQSCLSDGDSDDLRRPTALVTVCPADDGGFTMNLDNSTVLVPTNLKTSPFGKKEVRALVNYTDDPKGRASTQNVRQLDRQHTHQDARADPRRGKRQNIRQRPR